MNAFASFIGPGIDFLIYAFMACTPILFGTLGEIVNEKSGHLNLGVPGMMAIGGTAGFLVGYYSNNLVLALLGAFLGGMLGSLIYAVLTVTFMANQNVTGLTLSIFGVGLANFAGKFALHASGLGTLKLPDEINSQLLNIPIPLLSWIPQVGQYFSVNIFVYLAVIIAALLSIYLHHTKAGRDLRAIGENPAAADAAGIHVVRMKYIHLLLGGGICGLGGAYAAMITGGGVWGSDFVGELGWIAVALVIFAAWKPGRAVPGAFVFGALRVLRFRLTALIMAPAALVPEWQDGLTGVATFFKDNIPEGVFDMLPFLMTALVLIITSMRKSKEGLQPASCGTNYFREER